MAMALQVAIPTPTRLAVPTTLHVGSGKNWQQAWLNLDVDPQWRPDLLWDLNRPLPEDGQLVVQTERFGEIVLGENIFDEIIAQDVLEHIGELTTAMRTMLHWLKPGGVLKVAVPYELSLGAWSDPTHVRAFNERSFEYYTNWSWYLGWRTHNFRLARMDFLPTEFGKELVGKGVGSDEILRTPRAIEQIYVELVKQRLGAEALRATAELLDRPRG